jgi:hypothetical protein
LKELTAKVLSDPALMNSIDEMATAAVEEVFCEKVAVAVEKMKESIP